MGKSRLWRWLRVRRKDEERRLFAMLAIGVPFWCSSACQMFASVPTAEEVVGPSRRLHRHRRRLAPPTWPRSNPWGSRTAGHYSADGEYWPVRVRVKGGVKVKVTNVLQFGLIGDAERQSPKPVDFVEEGRFTKDDYGNLPEMDGCEFLTRIRSNAGFGYIPVVAITADGAAKKRIIEAGFDAYLFKPVPVGVLAAQIHKLVAR